MGLFSEGADYPDAGNIFTQNRVDPVQKSLQALENRGSPADDKETGGQKKNYYSSHQISHIRMDSEGEQDSENTHHRYGKHHLDAHHKGALDGIDVI